MVDKLHGGVLTSFSGGELTPQLAGRVDKEEMKIGSRYVSNFIPEHQGGLKKFYGSGHISKVIDDITTGYRMVPFDGCGEPLCLLFVPGKVYCVTRTDMYQVAVDVSLQMMMNASYVQTGDVMYITNESMGQAAITYSGIDTETGHHKFSSSGQKFVTEPFFPLNWQGNYNGLPLHTSASTGYITITGSTPPDYYSLELPDVLQGCGSGKNITSPTNTALSIVRQDSSGTYAVTLGSSVLELRRVRAGVESVVQSATIGSEQETSEYHAKVTINSNGHRITIPAYTAIARFKRVTAQGIVDAFNAVVGGTGEVVGGFFRFYQLPTGHASGDSYYFTFTQGASYNTGRSSATNTTVNGYTATNSIAGYTQNKVAVELQEAPVYSFLDQDVVGRKLKISLEHQNTNIKSWAEGITVATGDIVYSDGHYYECMGAGGTCGQTQPTHTYGTYSDGKINWLYLHSGYGYVTIISVESSTVMRGRVDSLLPYTSGDYSAAHDWNNYQWSMWGYKGRFPNQVFLFNGRLGYTLDTVGYGSWLQLSKSDEFDDFSVEEFGETVDTCAINTLISEYNENRINWIISGYRLYMGSYAGEYNVSGGDENKSVLTPSNCNILPVSQAGGGPVKATKFEDLNLFASADKKQLFSLKYDYTSDDYIPSDIGFAGEDLLSAGINSMWHLRGYDRNLYLRTDDKKLVVINQPEDVKALGFFRVDMQGDALDHCVSNANGESVLFTMIKRGDVISVEYIEPDYRPYMLNTKDYRPAGGADYVASTITDVDFASQTVYVYDANTGEFERQEIGALGVINNPYETTHLMVGIEMPCEVHTHPLYNDKFETTQQKSVRYTIRVVDSGAFSYGSSNDFGKWYDYNNWNVEDNEEYGTAHNLMTGDIKLPSSFGYQQAQNQANSKYPNDTAVALSLKAVTPEPFNLLLVSSVYV